MRGISFLKMLEKLLKKSQISRARASARARPRVGFLFCLILCVLGALALGAFFLSGWAGKGGEVREFTLTAEENQWRWRPEEIEVRRGDTVKMTVINQDEYDHGFAIDELGVSQFIPAGETVHFEFAAGQAGEFSFYCFVQCGDGEAGGEHRGHFDMTGKFRVVK